MNDTSWNLIGAILTTLALGGLVGPVDHIAASDPPASPVSTADPLLAQASPTPTPIPTITPSPTPTSTPKPSSTPTPIVSPTPAVTPEPSSSPALSPTPTPISTIAQVSPSLQSSPSSTPAASPTPTGKPEAGTAISNFIQPPDGLLSQPVIQSFYQSKHLTEQGTIALAMLGSFCTLLGIILLWGQQIRRFLARGDLPKPARSLYYRLTTLL